MSKKCKHQNIIPIYNGLSIFCLDCGRYATGDTFSNKRNTIESLKYYYAQDKIGQSLLKACLRIVELL